MARYASAMLTGATQSTTGTVGNRIKPISTNTVSSTAMAPRFRPSPAT